LRFVILSLLIFSAVLTHYGNGAWYARFSSDLRAFWWQVSWRVPNIQEGKSLVVQYPRISASESRDVWGPANHLYYPVQVAPGKIQTGVSAIFLNQESVLQILMRESQGFRKDVIVESYPNYRNFVILAQPSFQSCVHVIDGNQPEFSRHLPNSIMMIAHYSDMENVILLEDEFKTPPPFLFGPEPKHDWCFYYQKATYERQKGDWHAVVDIGNQALAQGFAPKDTIEWLPFLQAYAYTNNIALLEEIAPNIAPDPFIAGQACASLKNMANLSPDVEKVIDELYCNSK
jgi:hypothetical protein